MCEIWILTRNSGIYEDVFWPNAKYMFVVTNSAWIKSDNLEDLVPYSISDIDLGTEVFGVEISLSNLYTYVHIKNNKFPISMPLTLFEETYKNK